MSSFVAEEDIEPGTSSSRIIQRNIERCKFFVLILTITALKSSEVKKEFALAKKLCKDIMPCVKASLEEYVKEDDFNGILDFQHIEFETKEELANSVVEAILKKEIANFKKSLRTIKTSKKQKITRKDIVDSLLSDLISTRAEIHFWLTEPNADPNQEYVPRRSAKIVEEEKKAELQRIRRDIADNGATS
jgi:hypothetical protein